MRSVCEDIIFLKKYNILLIQWLKVFTFNLKVVSFILTFRGILLGIF